MKKVLSYLCILSMLISCLCISSISASAEDTTYTKTIDFDTTLTSTTYAFANGYVNGTSKNQAGIIDYTEKDSSYADGKVLWLHSGHSGYNNYGFSIGKALYGKKVKSISFKIWANTGISFTLQGRSGLNNGTIQSNAIVKYEDAGVSSLSASATPKTVTLNFKSTKACINFNDTYFQFCHSNTNTDIYIDNIVITYEKFAGTFTGAAEGDKIVYADEDGVITTPDATLTDGEFAGWVTEDDADNIIPANTQLTLTDDVTYAAVVAERGEQEAPSAPVLESKTSTTVTLVANSNYQYSIDGTTWQNSNVFTGLSAATQYTFYQRYKATATLKASPASKGLKVETASVFTFEAEKAVSTASGTYSGTLNPSSSNSDTGTGSLVYVVHDASNPAVGHYVTYNFTGLKPGYYQISLFSRNVANSRSTYNVTAYDETNEEQDAGSINFADLSTKYGNNTYYCNPSLANNVVVNSGSTLKLKFTISKVGTGSGSYIDKFVLTKVGDLTDPLAVDVATESSASIRLGRINGIRFYTTVDQAKISELIADGATVEMGTLIAPVDLLGNDDLTLDLDESKYVNVGYNAIDDETNDYIYHEDGDFSGIVGSIANIKESNTAWSATTGNITRDFVGRAYVKVTKDGEETISYSEALSSARSLKTVAAAIDKTSEFYTNLSEEQQGLVDSWANAEK